MLYAYPCDLLVEPEGVTATFPDVPGAITCGDTEAEALGRAEDALVSMLSALVEDGAAIPVPGAAAGRPVVAVPPLEAVKLALHSAMLEGGMSNVELGRRLGLDERAVRRLRDPMHRSHIGQVEAALRSLGRRVAVEVLAVS